MQVCKIILKSVFRFYSTEQFVIKNIVIVVLGSPQSHSFLDSIDFRRE
jgi:hypothetical protein